MMRETISFAVLALSLATTAAHAAPETVTFKSADGATEIVGYLFRPQGAGPHPAIVLLHGRGGPYSLNVNRNCTFVRRNAASPCNAATLSKRHAMWGEFWASRGVIALLPDSFGPRGKGHGFGRFTHDDPERVSVNELTVRPLDAEGALAYLRMRSDVDANRVFVQGWSNGGSTALNVMIRQGARAGFRAALAFYPGCGRTALLDDTIRTSAPITMFLAEHDEEVSPTICQHVAERSLAAGTKLEAVTYPARRMISMIPASGGNRCRRMRRRRRMRWRGRCGWWRSSAANRDALAMARKPERQREAAQATPEIGNATRRDGYLSHERESRNERRRIELRFGKANAGQDQFDCDRREERGESCAAEPNASPDLAAIGGIEARRRSPRHRVNQRCQRKGEGQCEGEAVGGKADRVGRAQLFAGRPLHPSIPGDARVHHLEDADQPERDERGGAARQRGQRARHEGAGKFARIAEGVDRILLRAWRGRLGGGRQPFLQMVLDFRAHAARKLRVEAQFARDRRAIISDGIGRRHDRFLRTGRRWRR